MSQLTTQPRTHLEHAVINHWVEVDRRRQLETKLFQLRNDADIVIEYDDYDTYELIMADITMLESKLDQGAY